MERPLKNTSITTLPNAPSNKDNQISIPTRRNLSEKRIIKQFIY
uniref:Uncharacterized protein n=1 Tax=Arundo donax TaxID=35708 RepID=A0A0A8ZLJ9_ARUDO